jgi:hypothetical protein
VFRGSLRPQQVEVVETVIPNDDGVVCAPTAFGKTAVAAWLIAHRKVSTLVLVHRQQLLDQWRERLAMFLDLPIHDIGQIGGGKTNRKDGHHPIIYMQCGPLRYRMSARTMTATTPYEHVVIPRPTDFLRRGEAGDITIQDVHADLVSNESRNDMIAGDLVRAIGAGRSPLLLTGRTEHLGVFANKGYKILDGAAVPATVANNVRSAVARMAGHGISCLARDPGKPAHFWCQFLALGRVYRFTSARQISQISMSGVESKSSCRIDDGYGTNTLFLL